MCARRFARRCLRQSNHGAQSRTCAYNCPDFDRKCPNPMLLGRCYCDARRLSGCNAANFGRFCGCGSNRSLGLLILI